MPGGYVIDQLIERAFEFTDRANSHLSATALIADFSGLVRQFGFNHFIMTGLPAYGDDVEQLIVANAWPVAWLDRYREGNYFVHDPVSREAMLTSRKYSWGEARSKHPGTNVSRQIESEAKEFGLVDGLAFPMFDPDNWQAIVSLSSDQSLALPDRFYSMIFLAAATCQSKATELLAPRRQLVPRLTPRECDVLTWMAHGKTRGETAEILGLSEETIKTHLAQIASRLNVVNTAQAIAKAVTSRQIRL